MTARRFFSSASLICLILALLLVWRRTTPQRLAFGNANSFKKVKETSTKVSPISIKIERLGITLDIFPANLSSNHWQVTDKGVSYLSLTPIPGDLGNSVLYGHNWPNLLGKLIKIKPGDKIVITYSNGTTKNFLVEYTATVKPNQTYILNPSSDHRITIYTCTGFMDSKRFVAVATIIS